MKMKKLIIKYKIIDFIQGLSYLLLVISSTFAIGGADLQETDTLFYWQYWTGMKYILISISIIGCMELLKRVTKYQLFILRRKQND